MPAVLECEVRPTLSPPRAVRVAVLGGGAAAELCHLPALRRCAGVEPAAIVDLDGDRAAKLAREHGVGRAERDWHAVLDDVDAVINALPHDLHASVSIECLERGIGVLVEKPMARTAAEARAMIEAADRSGAVLQVGLMYRVCDGPRLLKRSIESGRLGEIHSFSLEWGSVYDWPVRSGFFFDRDRAGGGVLIDTGSHALDMLSWLLGPLEVADYADDARGGVEGDCQIMLRARSFTGRFDGRVTLSRLRPLTNAFTIRARHWEVSYDLNTPDRLVWRATSPDSFAELPSFEHLSGPGQSWADVYAEQLTRFVAAVNGGESSAMTDLDAMAGVRLIDACYADRRPLACPWDRPGEEGA